MLSLWVRSWLKRQGLAVPRGARRAARRGPRWRPLLEALEPRCLPTAISLIQNIGTSTTFNSGGVASLSIPITTPVAPGHAIVVALAETISQDFAGATSVTDSAGNNYLSEFSYGGNAAHQPTMQVFDAFAVKPLAAGSSITISYSAGVTAVAASASEFYGITVSDQVGFHSGTGTSPDSGPLLDNTAQANELLLGTVAIDTSSVDGFTPGAGYTALAGAGTSGAPGGDATIYPEFRTVSAVGAYSAGGTLASSADWLAHCLTYRADTATHLQVTAAASTVGAGHPSTSPCARWTRAGTWTRTTAARSTSAPTGSPSCRATTRLPWPTRGATRSPSRSRRSAA
jgi:hypothetical protein